MNQEELKKILPQRYPFLFIDKIAEFEKGKRLTALKNVTVNEEFFGGHFPEMPVMPGVLLIEAMGQAAIVFLNLSAEEVSSRGTLSTSEIDKRGLHGNLGGGKRPEGPSDVYYLAAVKARFFKPVVPGDQVRIEVEPVKVTKEAGIVKAVAKVDGVKVAQAELTGAKMHGVSHPRG